MNIEQMKEIVNNAPDGATHYCSNSQYWRMTHNDWQVYESHHGNCFWVDESPIYLRWIKHLSDLHAIIAQHEEIERLREENKEALRLISELSGYFDSGSGRKTIDMFWEKLKGIAK